jgi:phosphoribosyl 1,2-cyclic phosphodiesterase
MSDHGTELFLRVNGIQPAFGIEFGFANERADEGRTDPYRQANVSYSLVQRREGKVIRHTLIDVGMGVVPSLLEFEASHDVHVINEVFITHPHFDHFAQLDWLSMCLVRNGRDDQPRPLPNYASQACWEAGPNTTLKYVGERSDFRPLEPGTSVALGDITITPFAVDHGPQVPGAMGFVVQHADHRIVISGDFHHVPDEDNSLLFDSDVCFLDTNTWHPVELGRHQSVLGNLRLIEKWKPKRTYFIHYSGYEDRDHGDDPINGAMGMERFREEVQRVSGDHDVQPARHGMILGDDVAWPA